MMLLYNFIKNTTKMFIQIWKKHLSIFLKVCILVWLFISSENIFSQTLYLVYTANLNCNLESCHCDDKDLGGMLRLFSAVDSLKKKYPDLILIDTGDFFNSYPLPEANALMCELMNEMEYDAIGIGDQEFVEGLDFLLKQFKQFSLPLLNGNIYERKRNRPLFRPYSILNRDGLKILLFGVTSPQSFEFIEAPGIQLQLVKNSIQKILEEVVEKIDLTILLYHAGYNEAKKIAEVFPEIQIIVAGHTQEKFSLNLEKQIIVQPGFDGEYIGFLEINISEEGLKFNNSFIPIHSGFRENEKFRKKVNDYYKMMRNIEN